MHIRFFFLVLINWSFLQAQTIVTTSGDFFESAQGSFSWTLGEPVSETFSNSSILTQGFQQYYENILSVEQLSENLFPIVYPNPFHEKVYLNLSGFKIDHTETQVILIDNMGRIILQNAATDVLTIEALPDGIYHLEIRFGNSEKYTYKLIKTAN